MRALAAVRSADRPFALAKPSRTASSIDGMPSWPASAAPVEPGFDQACAAQLREVSVELLEERLVDVGIGEEDCDHGGLMITRAPNQRISGERANVVVDYEQIGSSS